MRIAIIGSGVSGSLVARLLSTAHEVVLFEAASYLGGHANTVEVQLEGKNFAVDTGFMVFNQRTYPNFCRLLNSLNVSAQASCMSFSVHNSDTGLEYQGSSFNGLFAQRSNLLRPSFLRMLADVLRFNRLGKQLANEGSVDIELTVGEFLERCRVGKRFIEEYLVPMAAAIWSSQPAMIYEFPAKFLIGFFANHGLMQVADRPQWMTIPGGSRVYIESLLKPLRNQIRLNTEITNVWRTNKGVEVVSAEYGTDSFDRVVFATHADQTLRLLDDASDLERDILGCFPYQANRAILHTDISLLPRSCRAWASWNYHVTGDCEQSASVTYDLSRLQKLNTPKPLLLTLNETESIDTSQIIDEFNYHHPAYTLDSIAAQDKHRIINGQKHTHFCGAYWGYGFHEDGVNSALAVARQFGIGWEQFEGKQKHNVAMTGSHRPANADKSKPKCEIAS